MKKAQIPHDQHRQGDVLCKIEKLPVGAKLVKSLDSRIAARGEFSDHCHVITGDCDIYEHDGRMYVKAGKKGVTLQHTKESMLPVNLENCSDLTVADHPKHILKANEVYDVTIQNEFNPYDKLFQKVAD